MNTTPKTNDTTSSSAAVIDAPNGDGDAEMMRIAMEADAAPEGAEFKPSSPSKPTDDATPGEQGADGTPGDKKKPVDKKDGKPTDKKDAKPGEQGAEDRGEKSAKPETPFEKAKKEKERQENLLKNFQTEKEQFRQERSAFQAELQGLRREVSELKKRSQSTGPAKDANGLTAADYESLAKDYEAKGNDTMATAAKERAEALRKQTPAPQSDAPAGDAFNTPEFQSEWKRHTQEAIEKDPELANPANPIVKATNDLIGHPVYGRFFRTHPDGVKVALEVAGLMREAHAAQQIKTELAQAREEISKAKAENERLNGLLQPRGSHPAAPAKGKADGPLSDADVFEIAKAADRGEI